MASLKPYSIKGRDPPPPNQDVRRTENGLETTMAVQTQDTTKFTRPFPTRPGYGTRGERVQLWANYVDLNIPIDLKFYRYEIETSPTVVGKKLERVVDLFINSDQMSDFRRDIVTDFKKTLISRKDLGSTKGQTFKVSYFGEHEERKDVVTHQVRLVFQYVLPVTNLLDYVKSNQLAKHYPQKLEMIQSLNIFLNHYTKSNPGLITLGANKTYPQAHKIDLDVGMQGLRGYFASVRLATNRVLVNVNITHSAFFREITLVDLMSLFKARFEKHRPKANPDKGNEEMLFALHYFLQGVRVMTKPYRGGAGLPIKIIKGLATKRDCQNQENSDAHPPQVIKFGANMNEIKVWVEPEAKGSSGEYVLLSKHLREKFNGTSVAINPNMPVVNVGRETPFYLPATACKVISGQPASSKLDDEQVQQMTKIAIRPPMDNAFSIVSEGLDAVGLNPNLNQKIKDWGLKTEPRLITVQGRQLSKPTVHYASTGMAKVGGDAGWNLLSHRFRSPKTLPKWAYLMLSPPFENEKIPRIMRDFVKIMQQTGIATSPPTEPTTALSATRLEDMAVKLDGYFKTTVQKGVMLIFVVLPSPNSPYYNIVKRLGDAKYGIATVCMNVKKLTKDNGQDQYLRNISMKVNLKLGGGNHVVGPEQLKLISPSDTMIVGVDVTHPSPGSSSSAPSIAAMVASVDNALGQWPAVLTIQNRARQEMVSGLTSMLESRIRLWEIKNGNSLPENILVYRDGVSEGQYNLVIDDELPALRKACKDVYGDSYKEGHNPRLTIIVVGKRHHSRFYPTDVKNAHVSGNTRDPNNIRNGNAKAGTVVDRGVTEGQNWDFFLQAHSPIKGTARPAHQFVLLDEIFRSKYANAKPPGYQNVADVVEEVTQALCYSFGRATRAVSVCTPAYYADLACERARRYFDHLYAPAAYGIGAASRPDTMPVASSGNVRIHENLKHSMFYI